MDQEHQKDDQEHQRDVSGHSVYFDDDCDEGVEYLDHRIDYQESQVFFNAAKSRGSVEFEDQEGRDYTLRYKDGRYQVEKRKKKSGWWPF